MEKLNKVLDDLENKYGSVDDTLNKNKDNVSYTGRDCSGLFGGGDCEYCRGAMGGNDF